MTVIIEGTARNISSLTLNGNTIAVNQENAFSELLLLSPGFNIIEIAAQDRFDRIETEHRIIIYEPKNIEIQTASSTQ